ncbi:MAG: hypothetical protein H6970_04860 [Gammaproteobacteria bacterium]|nr:hypothetical protein [Gammaproteobacteria bacterium]MCP5424380.1 hypothetical protein [Gammaproteobacteria bacterium]
MSELSDDKGVLAVLIERLEQQRIPRALKLKEKVDSGERLGDADLAFLKTVFADANQIKPLIDRRPFSVGDHVVLQFRCQLDQNAHRSAPGIPLPGHPGIEAVLRNHGKGAGERTKGGKITPGTR